MWPTVTISDGCLCLLFSLVAGNYAIWFLENCNDGSWKYQEGPGGTDSLGSRVLRTRWRWSDSLGSRVLSTVIQPDETWLFLNKSRVSFSVFSLLSNFCNFLSRGAYILGNLHQSHGDFSTVLCVLPSH